MLETNELQSSLSLNEPTSGPAAVALASSTVSLKLPEIAVKTPVLNMDTNERQRRYVEAQKAKGSGLGVVFQDAFIRGMRDIGYKNAAWSMAEIIDNAIQAAAQSVEIRLGFNADN